jgi:hypothetical protein
MTEEHVASSALHYQVADARIVIQTQAAGPDQSHPEIDEILTSGLT